MSRAAFFVVLLVLVGVAGFLVWQDRQRDEARRQEVLEETRRSVLSTKAMQEGLGPLEETELRMLDERSLARRIDRLGSQP